MGNKECYVKVENDRGATKGIELIWSLSFVISIATMGCFLKYGLQLEKEKWIGIWGWVRESNFNLYLSTLLCFFSAFLISRYVLFKFLRFPGNILSRDFHHSHWKIITAMLTASVLVPLLNWLFIQQYFEANTPSDSLPISKIPIGYSFVIAITGLMLILWAVQNKKDFSENWLIYFYAFCVVLTFWALYFPNIFRADLFHGIAVLESIFNVADLTPYTYATTGIYGHNALFFLLPLKIFGCDIETVAALMAICGCIACVAVLYTIHHMVQLNWMRMMIALASLFHIVIMRWSNIWQAQPIRILFPSVFIAYAVYLCKNENRSKRFEIVCGWILSVLAILWNTETGVFCMIAFVAFLLTEQWQKYKWYCKRMWLIYGLSVVFCLSAVLGSVIILNIYNLCCGGPFVFRTFFFPLQVHDYMNGSLRWDPVWGNRAWLQVLILFLMIFCWGIYHTKWFRKEEKGYWKMAPAAVLIATIGLLNLSYYINRAAWHNLDICFPIAICANALLIGTLWPQLVNKAITGFIQCCKKTAALICIMVIFVLSLQILYAPVRIKERHEGGSQNTIDLRREVEVLRSEIPENTFGIGEGISIIYHILGWDNYGHYRDLSDLFVGGTVAFDEMVKDTLSHDSFLCSANYPEIRDNILDADWHYQYEKSVIVQGREYQYFVKRPYKCNAFISEDNMRIHIIYRDDNSYTSVRAMIWNEGEEHANPQWVSANCMGQSIWEGDIELSDLETSGNYIVQFYSIDGNDQYMLAETSVAIETLPESNVVEE